MSDRNLLDAWEDDFDEAVLESAEAQLVERHDGGVNHVPSAVVATLLGLLLDEIERDLRADGEADVRTHKKFVLACQLENAVNDSWNGRWTDT